MYMMGSIFGFADFFICACELGGLLPFPDCVTRNEKNECYYSSKV
jgi:hypothetical protein